MSLLCDSHVKLRGMGVDSTLREKGAENGDLVRILNFSFEFVD